MQICRLGRSSTERLALAEWVSNVGPLSCRISVSDCRSNAIAGFVNPCRCQGRPRRRRSASRAVTKPATTGVPTAAVAATMAATLCHRAYARISTSYRSLLRWSYRLSFSPAGGGRRSLHLQNRGWPCDRRGVDPSQPRHCRETIADRLAHAQTFMPTRCGLQHRRAGRDLRTSTA
jgi:hypothetical protein